MRSVLLLASLLLFCGCQNFSENSLGTDLTLQAKCPANGCADHTPNENELSLEWVGAPTVLSASSDATVQLGGNCYPSTYPDNRIEVIVYNSARQAVATDITSPVGGVLQCTRGRFNLVFNGTALAPGPYRVRVELIGFDSNGTPHRGGSGPIEIAVNRLQ